jgi:methyl-accepting chemotaxis protein
MFENMKIRAKLVTGFTTVVVLAAVVGVVGVCGLISIARSGSELYKYDALDLQYSGNAAVYFQQLSYGILKMKTVTTQAEYDATKSSIAEYRDLTAIQLAQFQSNIQADKKAPEELLALTSGLMSNWESYSADVDNYFTYLNDNKTDKISEVRIALADKGNEIREQFLQLLQLVSDKASKGEKTNSRNAIIAVAAMAVVFAIAVILAVMMQTLIIRSIVGPIVKLEQASALLAVGDINMDAVLTDKDYQIKDRKDEIGKLALAFNRLIAGTRDLAEAARLVASGDLTTQVNVRSENDVLGKALADLVANLRTIVLSVINAADQVASGSLSLSDSSAALSQGATEQASSVEELTASLEQIASQTELNSQNADRANALATKAKSDAVSGNEQMKEMLKAMDEINASSSSISRIIKVIDDIAFQTNILALNAAVEAARAGQHGLGFAVVAEEVRTLAAKSAGAANETTELIENSIRKVEAGTKIANDTAKALDSIVEGVENAAGLVASIAASSREQAAAIEQINQGVIQISQVVQTNAATSEESAAASQELSSQAAQLKELVNIFKIDDGGAANAASQPADDAEQEKGSVRDKATHKPTIALNGGEFGKY